MKHLGHSSQFPDRYSPQLLEPIARTLAREALGIKGDLPFRGEDVWNAYELTWLDTSGYAETGLLRFSVPADSPNIVESKSVKLYLGGFTNERVEDSSILQATLTRDLSAALGVPLAHLSVSPTHSPGDQWQPTDPQTQGESGKIFSPNLRSLCPVTGQPDFGTCVVWTSGVCVPSSWLESQMLDLRQHQGFHEELCERIFLRVLEGFNPISLSVGCWYNRRGGIDINPIRRTPDLPPGHSSYLCYTRTIRQ